MTRTFGEELKACESKLITNLEKIEWRAGNEFRAFDSNGNIDEGSPYLWNYNFNNGRIGFLICWPAGTRLQIQTHPVVKYYSWRLDPEIEIIIPEEMAA